jgi:hypothetical protein
MIFNTSELSKVDFSEVLETSIDTVRKSVDESKVLIKWEGDEIPSSISGLSTVQGPYTYEEILEILDTVEWQYVFQPGNFTV